MQKKSMGHVAFIVRFIGNLVLTLCLFSGCCKKKTETPTTKDNTLINQKAPKPTNNQLKKEIHQKKVEKIKREKLATNLKKQSNKKNHPSVINPDNKIDFDVENKTGKTQFVACFAYMKKHTFNRWRWVKSPIYQVDDNEKVTINLPPIDDDEDRVNTFGYLAVFKDQESAEDAIYELLPDSNKIELDLLTHLKGKKVVLEIEKYGFKKDFFDYDFVHTDQASTSKGPSLDFVVENKTGKTVIVTCFVFEKKAKGTWLAEKTKVDWKASEESRDDMAVWRFDKTPIITLKNGESGKIKVDNIIEGRDRKEVRGYLAIFDEDEQDQAEKATYELLPSPNKLQLNKLENLKNKKVILEVEEYGIVDDIFDYKVKPIRHIDFTKVGQPKHEQTDRN